MIDSCRTVHYAFNVYFSKGDRAQTVELKIDLFNCAICETDKNNMIISNLKFERFFYQNRQN